MKTINAVTRAVLGVLAIALAISSPALAQKSETRPVRVYVFTAASEGGFVDAESKGRTDSLEDVRKALGKKKSVALVKSQEEAELSLEIVSRGKVPDGRTSFYADPVFGTAKASADKVATLYTMLSVGSYSTGIVGKNDGRITNVWETAAGNAVDIVDKWIKDKRENPRASDGQV